MDMGQEGENLIFGGNRMQNPADLRGKWHFDNDQREPRARRALSTRSPPATPGAELPDVQGARHICATARPRPESG